MKTYYIFKETCITEYPPHIVAKKTPAEVRYCLSETNSTKPFKSGGGKYDYGPIHVYTYEYIESCEGVAKASEICDRLNKSIKTV